MNEVSRKDRTKRRINPTILGAVLAALISGIFLLIVNQKGCNEGTQKPPIVAIDDLCKIEKQLIPSLEEGAARHNYLPTYFEEANKKLFQHLNSVAQKYTSRENHRGATYITGMAGVGKSYLIAQFNMLPADATTDPIKLSKLFNKSELPFTTEKAPDLQTTDGSVTFNELMRISRPEEFDFDQFLIASGALKDGKIMSFVLIDDLDEIHEDSAKLILEEMENYLRKQSEGFIHFIVFGRPEGFWPWLKHSDRIAPLNVTNSPFLLQGPVYQTTGDLEFRCNDYYKWKYKMDAPQEVISDFRDQIQNYPFLRYTIRPLSAGNFVLNESILWYKSKSKEHKSIEDLRNGLFSDMLDRNKESHGRPSTNDDKYMLILENIAAFLIEQGKKIDDNGFFEVLATDFIKFSDVEGKVYTVRIRDVLNRSGVALLQPSELRRTQYRFEPFWLHAHLIERRNQRIYPDHQYRWFK